MTSGQCVLVVDRMTETADVLRAVLEPRGVRVEEPEPGAAAPLDRPTVNLSVVVVDEETAQVRGIDGHEWRHVPRVVIGSMSLPDAPREEQASDGVRERRLSKPYHYADLLRAIEALIADRAQT